MNNPDLVTHIARTADETAALGQQLAAQLAGGEVIALAGELGAGKTVFARGVARGLGVTQPVTSPTFAIVQEYQGTRLRLYHLDLYRLGSAAEAQAFGVDELLGDPGAVAIIEWPERLGAALAAYRPLRVQLAHDVAGRRLRISGAAAACAGQCAAGP